MGSLIFSLIIGLSTDNYTKGNQAYENKNFEASEIFYSKACENGNLKGCTKLGILYMEEKALKQNHSKAKTLLSKACNGGNAKGCVGLGLLYAYSGLGNEVNQDDFKAKTFLTKACNLREKYCFALGVFYYEGLIVEQNYFKAKTFFSKACNDDMADGCFYLGQLYAFGNGAKQDKSKAKTLYGKACDGGSNDGCKNYAILNMQAAK